MKNEAKILLHILREKKIRRKELEKIVGVNPSTMTYLLDKLKDYIEIEEDSSTMGKPPQLVSISKEAWHILAVSVGRERIRAVVYNGKGEELESTEYKVRGEFLNNEGINELLRKTLEKFYDYDSLGIAFSGTVVDDKVYSKILKLERYDPVKSLKLKALGIPYVILSDVEAIAAYESKTTGKERVFVLNYGTGIGACYYEYHALFSKDEFKNIPLGHIYFDGSEKCYCGARGCLETVASDYVAFKKYTKSSVSFVEFITHEEKYLNDLKIIRNLHKADEGRAKEIYAEIIDRLAYVLGNLSLILGVNNVAIYGEGSSEWLAHQLEIKAKSLSPNFNLSVRYGHVQDAVERGVSLEAAVNYVKKSFSKSRKL
ncbi:Sugar kinase of the NBD/HSP70 family, may contain an N-terminal HTH domain [Fervidobacterium changbaicum]|uniref:ROK family transcriptional regulator n=2 Tax=Fervidobacterium TaxID=2422 RepID=A0AAI8CL16_FERIS|nr:MULTISPECIES: ROK family transcriptional regulator [Fervidobacterium]AMW32331.1 ROK family transcriptional regulator [Fervidobacterium islandicum]QAV32321.1 ROK family transcriptional regulator [Fervidobacterium changbaicum]SDH22508.1 Sugar kinase of the NBD/HSP70 family, may contain an N-terminal HTH domain [Fervidobacterium changbaicum]